MDVFVRSYKPELALVEVCKFKIILSQIRPFSLGSLTRCNLCCFCPTSLIRIRVSDDVHLCADLLLGGGNILEEPEFVFADSGVVCERFS
jgi:hypothetical protein